MYSDSACIKICHNVVSLGNVYFNRVRDGPSESGSSSATDTGDAERERWTSVSFAPEDRLERRKLRERSIMLFLCLQKLVVRFSYVPEKLDQGIVRGKLTSNHTEMLRARRVCKRLRERCS